ncbi:MAG: YggS family pyridoxal phosphate-dependent enzyme [Clostridia bacterium]|nr:YggS family pyridoxal phosphate-dependent enzyme [Clostridia bacterium]
MINVAENYRSVEERVSEACKRAGRPRSEVTLVAVTKYVDTERIGQAIDAGACMAGENHAQEFREKLTFYKMRNCPVRFIGQLQSNKIKYLIGEAVCIDSVDRLSLAEEIGKRAAKNGVVQDILIEVNIGNEEAKGGISPDAAEAFVASVMEIPNVRLRGLMCVPPAGEEARPYFRSTRMLFDRLRTLWPDSAIDTLSMGMSGDFETAIEEGATMVRVGSGIFGKRDRK